MVIGSMLPAPQRFLIRRIYCALSDPKQRLVPWFGEGSELWAGVRVAFLLQNRPIVDLPAWLLAHPRIVFSNINWAGIAAAERAELVGALTPAPELPQMIESQQAFHARIYSPKTKVIMRIMLLLEGTLWREVC